MITITPASDADIPLVAELAHRIWHRHYPGIISQGQIDYMLARGYAPEALAKFLRDDGAGMALARAAGEPVGFAAWYRPGPPSTTKLDKLYVLQEWHGHGIGRRLIEYVESRARADGARTLVLNVNKGNAGAIAAYRRCGFVVREEVEVDIGSGYVMDDFVMGKALVG
jgi:ribosomal protein S18 acetylase RimI-like enzyme